MIKIKEFQKEDIERVIEFERELRRQEPDTYYWEPDEAYAQQLRQSFDDPRFNTALSFLAVKGDRVIGRIDASFVTSRSDAACFAVYLDWICVLKSERHGKTAQALGLSFNTVSAAVKRLEDAGILTQTEAANRNRTFAYEAYLDILRNGT